MVRSWYMDPSAKNRKLENHRNPPQFISMEELFKLTGVEYYKLNPETIDTDGVLDEIIKKKGYVFIDESTCSGHCFTEEELMGFYTEHLHTDDEVRVLIEGAVYFDVRDKNDEWIRIEVKPGDMVILPNGLYHRFTMTKESYAKGRRYFPSKEPVWDSHFRPVENMECRQRYLKRAQNGFITTN